MGRQRRPVAGAVFPILPEHAKRIFGGRNVFAKYLPRETTSLTPGKRIIFYLSHDEKRLAGEATIAGIEHMSGEEAIKKYGDSFFLTEEELAKYIQMQEGRPFSKRLTVFILSDVKEYPSGGVIYEKPVTMAGRYITGSEYKRLIAKLINSGYNAL